MGAALSRLRERARVRVIESKRHPHLYPLPPKEGEEAVLEKVPHGRIEKKILDPGISLARKIQPLCRKAKLVKPIAEKFLGIRPWFTSDE